MSLASEDHATYPRGRSAAQFVKGTPGDLNDLSQQSVIAPSQSMLTPNPVKTLLDHSQGDDDVHVVPAFDVAQRRMTFSRSRLSSMEHPGPF